MKNVMKKAHEITKKIIRKGDSYRATFRLALSLAHSLAKKGENKMILKGTEKQVKWATDIVNSLEGYVKEAVSHLEERQLEKVSKARTRKIETLKSEMDSIKATENAKEIIENYKHLQNSKYTVDLMMQIGKEQKIADLSL